MFTDFQDYLAALTAPLRDLLSAGPEGSAAARAAYRTAAGETEARARAAQEAGAVLPFERACALFAADPFARFVLTALLAAEIAPECRPADGLTPDALLRLYAEPGRERAFWRIAWERGSAALRPLVDWSSGDGRLTLRETARGFLLGCEPLPPDCAPFDPPAEPAGAVSPLAAAVAAQLAAQPAWNVFLLVGADSGGAVAALGMPLLLLPASRLPETAREREDLAVCLALGGRTLCVCDLPPDAAPAALDALIAALWPDPLLLTSEGHIRVRAEGYAVTELRLPAAPGRAGFVWDDLILPAAQTRLLRHLCDRVRLQETVYETWGLGAKLPYGRGIRALFTGPPGTGKTMAAHILADELGRPLRTVDLSALVSKYIGETEKHIEAVFTEAERSGAILLFDEADALFGKRGEQRDANDRYANMQTAFLLRRFEDFDGVAILSTNLAANMDAAFARRIQVRIDFPPPGPAARRLIWARLLALGAPLAPDIDVEFLSEQFELTGSGIKNVVTQAAFLAAAAGGEVGMSELMEAMTLEYAKTDKILTGESLDGYWDEKEGQ